MSWVVYEAFGERKTVHAWSKDPRCCVARDALRQRLLKGWPVEEALTTPDRLQPQQHEAFGQAKSLRDWAQDPRCQVSHETLRNRLSKGWTVEQALTSPLGTRRPGEVHTAWGVAKCLSQWAQDPRCQVSLTTLKLRVASGMTVEQALTSPTTWARTTPSAYEAFGQRKTLHGWARDPRCRVSGDTLRLRLLQDWPVETALTTPASRPGGRAPARYTAHGQTKSLRKWAQDPRCQVSEATLRTRLAAGTPLEQALRAPVSARDEQQQEAGGVSAPPPGGPP